MCLIALNWQPASPWPLQLLANRDEFFGRPTEGVHHWPNGILAGRDGLSGGSWLGVHLSGRFAAVTNYRDPGGPEGPRSRGELITNFLAGHQSVHDYLQQVQQDCDAYSGFNLLVGQLSGDKPQLGYLSNREGEIHLLAPGRYGLSNALLDTPWPKLVTLTEGLADVPADSPLAEQMALLTDTRRAADNQLPETGVGLAAEQVLSSVRIPPTSLVNQTYGTRSSSVLTLDRHGQLNWLERQWWPDGTWQDGCHGLRLCG